MKNINNKGRHFNSKSKVNTKRFHPCLLLLFLILIVLIININNILAFYTGFATLSNEFTIDAEYIISFDSNTGTGTMPNQVISYNVPTNLSANTFTKTEYSFNGWNTKADGTGAYYEDGQEITNLIGNNNESIILYAQWVLANAVAEIDGTLYSTLQSAVDAVTSDNTETIIKLLKNTSENIVIPKNKNIIFNLQNYTLSDPGRGCVLENNGTLKITNGTIQSSSTTDGAVNNNSTGNLTISGGKVIMAASKGKQAVYNNSGIVNITGGYFSSKSTLRATVQNLAGGTMNITGGTVIAEGNQAAVTNAGTMTIGTKDGSINKNSPLFQGATYGINSSVDYNFYDGIAKGKTSGINSDIIVPSKEEEAEIAVSEEMINGVKYKTAYLAITETITFNANGGTVSETTRHMEKGSKIGTLPVPKRVGYIFDGWFTLEDGGEQISEDTIINSDITFFAHWTKVSYAEINGVKYDSIQQAVDVVPEDNTETTIKILRDATESITVKKKKNIVFDIQNYTISNDGDAAIIENNGTVSIINGTLSSTAETAPINNNAGATLKISGGNILATERSAIYNNKGIVEISGGYLSSSAVGKPVSATLERGTVHNLQNGSVTITGGTIVGINQQAVSNEGTLTIGTKGDGINNTSPDITGKTYGVSSIGTFNFYDGIIRGITDSILGTITEQEANSQIINNTEEKDGTTYYATYLENL